MPTGVSGVARRRCRPSWRDHDPRPARRALAAATARRRCASARRRAARRRRPTGSAPASCAVRLLARLHPLHTADDWRLAAGDEPAQHGSSRTQRPAARRQRRLRPCRSRRRARRCPSAWWPAATPTVIRAWRRTARRCWSNGVQRVRLVGPGVDGHDHGRPEPGAGRRDLGSEVTLVGAVVRRGSVLSDRRGGRVRPAPSATS